MSKLQKIAWYANRLRAMGPSELLLRVRSVYLKKTEDKELAALVARPWKGDTNAVPELPQVSNFLPEHTESMRSEARQAIAGHWHVLRGHVWEVGDIPDWSRDYISQHTVETTAKSRDVNYRDFGSAVCPRTLWEASRWIQVVRVAQVAFLDQNPEMGQWCLKVLEDWVEKNPVGYGVQWTSPMEPGIRLINFTWIDALLEKTLISEQDQERRKKLVQSIVPPHAFWTWRYHSYGSSANNHLLGELAGLVLAQSRWPELVGISPSLDSLIKMIDAEVPKQFAADGGNLEQGLHYHLFAWEMCWQSYVLAESQGVSSTGGKQHLRKAARFFIDMLSPREPWDYGDSDDAHVTPLYANEQNALFEWRQWLSGEPNSSFSAWLGEIGVEPFEESQGWTLYPQSGMASLRSGDWKGRLDASPLGFGSMAAHGHLDALHLSLWLNDDAVLIDPGTGSYFDQPDFREWFKRAEVHNGPYVQDESAYPDNLGPFLWANHHEVPKLKLDGDELESSLSLRNTDVLSRCVSYSDDGILVCDTIEAKGQAGVNWTFAPEWEVKQQGCSFEARRGDKKIILEVTLPQGFEAELIYARSDQPQLGHCSPYFRKIQKTTVLRISGRVGGEVKLKTNIYSPLS